MQVAFVWLIAEKREAGSFVLCFSKLFCSLDWLRLLAPRLLELDLCFEVLERLVKPLAVIFFGLRDLSMVLICEASLLF